MKKGLFKSILITMIYAGVIYYLTYPPINLTAWGFWLYITGVLIIFSISYSLLTMRFSLEELFNRRPKTSLKAYKIFLVIPVMFMVIFIINIVLSPLFQAKTYYNRIQVDTDGIFEEETGPWREICGYPAFLR